MLMKSFRYMGAFRALAAVLPAAATLPMPAFAASAAPTTAAHYVPTAAAIDLFEIQSSQLALQKSQSEKVRSFAQIMIDHHEKTTQMLMQAASSASLSRSTPQLLPAQTKMLKKLQGLSGAKCDATYMLQQAQTHKKALTLHSAYAEEGDTPVFKTVAASAAR